MDSTVPPVAQFLRANHLDQYESLFMKAGFDALGSLDLLKTLSSDDLKEIGVSKLGHRKLLLNAIHSETMSMKSNQEIREFIENLANELDIDENSYFLITPEQIREHGGDDMLAQFHSLTELLVTGLYFFFLDQLCRHKKSNKKET